MMNEKIKWFLHVSIRDKLNPYLAYCRRKKIKYQDFTIISNNCWAGHVYRFYDIPYQTPTIGLYFFANDYLKFIKNLRYYLSLPLEFIDSKDSKYFVELSKRNQLMVPIGKLDDVEIVFLHYKTNEEASEKWKRRVKKVNYDHLLIKNSIQNGCTASMVQEFDRIQHEPKFIFVNQQMSGIKSSVIYKKSINKSEVEDDVLYFKKYINLSDWINNKHSYRI